MGLWDRIKAAFTDAELKKLDEVAGTPPALPPKPEPKVIEAEFEEGPYLMYNMKGGEALPYTLLEEFKAKSRRRALRYFKGKEVKHRVTHRSRTQIELEFNRPGDPNVVPGGSVKIRWTNKDLDHAVDA